MKRNAPPLLALAASGALALSAITGRAQQPSPAAPVNARSAEVTVSFKDGHQVAGTAFHPSPDGGTLLVTQPVGDGTGEIGYPLTLIATVNFPEPPQTTAAQEQLAQGKDAEALKNIDPVAAYYSPLRYVPGNWWLPAALVRLDALAGLRRERDVDALLSEVARLPGNPVAAEAVKLRSAEAGLRRGDADKAAAGFDELIRTSADDKTLARAWVGRGRVHLDRREFEPALLAYLHVPVFYPDDRRPLSEALLGSGRAFVGMDNRDKAREAFQQIITDAPGTPPAVEARAEIQKIEPTKPTS